MRQEEKRARAAANRRIVAQAKVDTEHVSVLDSLESQLDSIYGAANAIYVLTQGLDPDQQELEEGMFCPACGKAFKSSKQLVLSKASDFIKVGKPQEV